MSLFTTESFRDLGLLDDRITRQLDHLKFTTTTLVQKASIPAVLTGGDCLIRSPTGSGKTLSFAVPALQRFLAGRGSQGLSRDSGLFCMVVSPSKELSAQTQGILEQLVRMMPGIVIGCLAGGENPQKEKHRIRKGLTFVCGTPGRLLYHLENTDNFKTSVSQLSMLILDEADRLLDLGFEKQIRKIIDKLPSSGRQTVMVSATLSDAVKTMSSWCLAPSSVFVNPHAVSPPSAETAEPQVASENFVVASDVVQSLIEVGDERSRLLLLMGVLIEARKRGMKKVMVFFSSCASVDFHINLLATVVFPPPPQQNTHLRVMTTREIKRANAAPAKYNPDHFRPTASSSASAPTSASAALPTRAPILSDMKLFKLHGDLNTADRNGNIASFRRESPELSVLLTTDVSARGIDMEIDLVIQYDAPQQAEEYLHRIGRTGRIGRKGSAMIFLNSAEKSGFVELLMSMCQNMKRPVELEPESLIDAVRTEYKRAHVDETTRIDKIRDVSSYLTGDIGRQVTANPGLLVEARKAFVSTLRAYRTFHGRKMREIFDWRNVHSGHLAKNFGIGETPKEIAVQNKETEMFKKRPHNLVTREKLDYDNKQDPTNSRQTKKKKLGRSTNTIANLEFAA